MATPRDATQHFRLGRRLTKINLEEECLMWRISSRGLTLQEVLIMAYMNVLEARS